MRRCIITVALSYLLCALAARADETSAPLQFTVQDRVEKDNACRVRHRQVNWQPSETAVVICDMWDTHTCKNAAMRVAEMAPRMNEVVKRLRERGCLVIHCPSDTMDFYKDQPGRKLAQAAPPVETKIPLARWCKLDEQHENALPIDDSDGGCDTPADEQKIWRNAQITAEPDRRWPWTRQIKTIEIEEGDAITDSAEAYYLMRERGIKNVVVLGVHTNMCVLGRPFSIRQMVYQGQNVLLMRDMTDAMYNPAMRPQVSHFRGTELVIEHIERHWCGTITSADVLEGAKPFVFSKDDRPHVALVIGEAEYQTNESLAAFAAKELPDYRCTFVLADEEDPNYFAGLEALESADLLFLSVRRRTLPTAQLKKIRAYVESKNPIVAIRTASHAFALRSGEPPKGHAVWPEFDRDILGGNYHNHHGTELKTFVERAPSAKDHPLLAGVPDKEFPVTTSLYMTSPLADTTTLLMTGRVDEGVEKAEPVAWTNNRDGQRVFYTSLGGPGDFENAAFRAMLKNAIVWSLK